MLKFVGRDKRRTIYNGYGIGLKRRYNNCIYIYKLPTQEHLIKQVLTDIKGKTIHTAGTSTLHLH